MDNNNNYQHVLYQQQRFYNYALSPSTTQHSSVNCMYPYTPTPSTSSLQPQQHVPGSIPTQQQQLMTPVPQQQQQQPFINDQRPTLLPSDVYNKQLTNTHYHQSYIQPPQYQNRQQQQLPYQQQQALFHKTLPMQNQNDKFLVDSNSLQHFQQLVQQNMYISLNQQQQQQQQPLQQHQQQFSQHHQPTNIHIPYQLGCHDSFYNQNTNNNNSNNNNNNNFMLNLLPNIDLQTRMQFDSSHKITRLKEIALAAAGIQYSDATYCASKLSTSPINVQIQNNSNFNSTINNNNNTTNTSNNLINTNLNNINNSISNNSNNNSSNNNHNNDNNNQNYQLSIDYKATSSYEMKCQDSMYNPGSVDSTISTSSQSSICDLTNSPFSDQVYEYAAGAGILSTDKETTTTIHHHEHNQLTTTTTTKNDEMQSLNFLIRWIDTDDTHLSEFELHMREIIKQQSALNLYISNNPATTTTTTNHQSTTTTTTTTTSASTNATTDANNNTIYK